MGDDVSTVEVDSKMSQDEKRPPLIPPAKKSARTSTAKRVTPAERKLPEKTLLPDSKVTEIVTVETVTVESFEAEGKIEETSETSLRDVDTVDVETETVETETVETETDVEGQLEETISVDETSDSKTFTHTETFQHTLKKPSKTTAVEDSSVVQFNNVVKTYKTPHGDVHALSNVSFSVKPGDFVFLVGASGSGKSTILRLLIKEENVTEGNINVANVNLEKLKKRNIPILRQQVGTVFQDFRLLSDRTIYDNVAFGLKVLGRPSNEIEPTVLEVLHLVGLGDKYDRYPNELSGGEQQRAAIARAFASNPALLIADEPTGNLDPDTADGIIALLHAINLTGTTVIMATHDSRIVDALAKRVIRLDKGEIISDERHGDYAGSVTETASVTEATLKSLLPGKK